MTEILAATGLIADYGSVPQAARDQGMARGTALHRAIQWLEEGTLDRGSVHPEIRPGFDAYCRFVADTKHVPEASELELIHETHGFCGHLDRVGMVNGVRAICDWTYSDTPDTRGKQLQLAGYDTLLRHARPDLPAEKWYMVAFRKDGTYRLVDLTDAYAAIVFNAAVIVHRAREGK